MRIAMVCAHYPPNFTSGGTLIPQRIAEGMAARGHEVFVFAGALDNEQRDMAGWVETTPGGVQVTWTVINSMIDWAAEDNYRNPRIDAAFADFLLRTRPDVVHLHSLQGVGAGVASLARAHGAGVVLTMHDMWWWCARQFLAQKTMQPCSPVVNCGVCPCERDNAWLQHRDRLLAAQLDKVDTVLAPSSTMLELMAANGVDPRRLELDENPAAAAADTSVTEMAPASTASLPTAKPEPVAGSTTSAGPVRFVYAGGPHPLKGADVTVQAAALLSEVDGWQLDLYGMQRPDEAPEQVVAHPPYAAGEAASVLAAHDVLLMTSVASESYSLITREALDVGITVITGDNPGPTEVVTDGVNGLVVPRGDAEALAEAMRSLIDDRDLLATLKPEPGHIRLRTLDEQLDNLDGIYRRAVDAASMRREGLGHNASGDLLPISRVLLLTGIGAAPLRYRGRLPQEALADLGVRMDVRHYRDVEAPVLARSADAVVLYRVPATEQVLDLIDMVRRRPEPVPVLFDIDDLVFDPGVRDELGEVLAHLSRAEIDEYFRGVDRYRTTLEAADAYVGSTPMLCRAVDELIGMPTHLFANGVGKQLARASDARLRVERSPGPLRVGYLSGTSTHNEDWAHIEPAVLQVLGEFDDVQLWLGGLLEPSEAVHQLGERVVRLPLQPWQELPAVLRDLDVNLAPLAPGSRFNEAKSSIKWLEAALVGTPTIASPTEPFRADITPPGAAPTTGLLADDVDQWADALRTLLTDQHHAQRIGRAAQHRALLHYPPALQGRRYLQILSEARRAVAADGHREQFADWRPVYDSEPFIPVPVEPYEPIRLDATGAVARSRSIGRIAADYRRNAVDHLRSEGAARTARKAAEVAVRLPRRVWGRVR